MNRKRIGAGGLTILGVAISALGAVLFLFSDTLFGQSDLAYNLAFLGLILFPMGALLALAGLVELCFGWVKDWIKKRLQA